MGRNRPGKRERRARLRKLEAAALSIVRNFNPRHPGYFTARDSSPAAAPRETLKSAGLHGDPDCLDIPLEFSPIGSPEGFSKPPPLARADTPRPSTLPLGSTTPPRGPLPPLRVRRPRRDPNLREVVPETPRSRRVSTRTSSRSPRDRLRRVRHRHARSTAARRRLTRDPRFHLFPETRSRNPQNPLPRELPDRPPRVVVRLREERNFVIGYFLDSIPGTLLDCESPGSRDPHIQLRSVPDSPRA